jgi:hypothetical protein
MQCEWLLSLLKGTAKSKDPPPCEPGCFDSRGLAHKRRPKFT